MPSSPPSNGPYEFRGGDAPRIDQAQLNTAVFLAERLAGIEWQLVELNKNLARFCLNIQSLKY
jgi:hypothetical protein